MKRIILHWTAGGNSATALDRAHYHFLVEGDGKVVRGDHSIDDNVNTNDGDYAAHTLGANTRSIGVSMCGMAGASESPFRPGPAPIRKVQWEVLAKVVADLCETYSIPVTDKTVLGHGEVQSNLGIKQRGKWDPMVLPWSPGLSRREVGDQFRSMVTELLFKKTEEPKETYPSVALDILGVIGKGFLANESTQVPLDILAQAGIKKIAVTGDRVTYRHGGKDRLFEVTKFGEVKAVPASEVAAEFGLTLTWQAQPKKVTIR